MNNLYNDVQNLFNMIKNSNELEKYYSYLNSKKNLVDARIEDNFDLQQKRELLLSSQTIFDNKIKEELLKIDSLNIPIIGLKGLFIKNLYYSDIPRVSGDIDFLVESNNAKSLYKGLKQLDYHIETKTMYDNPIFNMNIIPEFYMENTQTLMMKNKENGVSIDIHSNLNITNAHFVHSHTLFNTKELFEHSVPFESYKNIRILEIHDNLCFLFRHLLKHHVFYGKTQTGLKTPVQHVLDLATIINSDNFDERKLFNRVIKYNVIPETIFCLNLYNKIFVSGNQICIKPYLKKMNDLNYVFKWKPLLEASLDMNIDDLMIGNFHKEFPKLQHAVEKSQSVGLKKIDWLIQAFILSFNIDKLLK